MQSPAWNQYRRQVIAAITDVEVLMQQRQKGLDTTVLTYEVAELLQLRIDNEADFEVLAQLAGPPAQLLRKAYGPLAKTRMDSFPSTDPSLFHQ